MTRRFVDKDRWKALRKLDLSLKQLYDYCWDMADAIGVYEVDWDYLKIDTGTEYTERDFSELMRLLPEWKKIVEFAPGKFLFVDFIQVVYEQLKPGYNPHKPAYRALSKHGLEINSSLNQALFKLVNEKEKEYEYKNEYEEEKELRAEKNFQIEEMKEEAQEIEVLPTFEDFWNEYDKKVGEKAKIKKKWLALKQAEREAIMEFIPNYKASQPDKQFRKNPETFLNNKSWNDEIIGSNGTGQQTNGSERAKKWANHFAKGT